MTKEINENCKNDNHEWEPRKLKYGMKECIHCGTLYKWYDSEYIWGLLWEPGKNEK